MIRNLLDSGCVLNVHELKLLCSAYVENAIKGNQVCLKVDNEKNNVSGDGIEFVTNITQQCKMNPSSICDEFQNNPLHLYISKAKSKDKNNENDKNKSQQLKEYERHNGLKLLVCECPDWLYQRNMDNNTPLSLAIKLRKVHLLSSLVMSLDSDKKIDDSEIVMMDVNNNKSRYDDMLLVVANDRHVVKQLYQLIVNLCNNILKSKMRILSINVDELKQYIDDSDDDTIAQNEFAKIVLNDENFNTVRFLTCDIKSIELQAHIESLAKTDGLWLELETVLECGDVLGELGGLNFGTFCVETMQMHVIQFLTQFFKYSITDNNEKQVM